MTSREFFVDEAGDLSLVGRRGKSLLGTEGVSNTFMVGVAHILEPNRVEDDLDDLWRDLLNDPYLREIPSMLPELAKTARCFHAKGDCAEVRMEVFKLIARHDIKVIVGIRRKIVLVELLQTARRKGMRLDPDSVYDNLVKTLFKCILHKSERNKIYFARRGKSSRQAALQKAINRAQSNFIRDTGISLVKPTEVIPAFPSEVTCLQVIDYILWALQRLYERNEDRYFNYLRNHYRLIMDFDDKRNGKDYGMWYTETNPLTKEKMLPTTG